MNESTAPANLKIRPLVGPRDETDVRTLRSVVNGTAYYQNLTLDMSTAPHITETLRSTVISPWRISLANAASCISLRPPCSRIRMTSGWKRAGGCSRSDKPPISDQMSANVCFCTSESGTHCDAANHKCLGLAEEWVYQARFRSGWGSNNKRRGVIQICWSGIRRPTSSPFGHLRFRDHSWPCCGRESWAVAGLCPRLGATLVRSDDGQRLVMMKHSPWLIWSLVSLSQKEKSKDGNGAAGNNWNLSFFAYSFLLPLAYARHCTTSPTLWPILWYCV